MREFIFLTKGAGQRVPPVRGLVLVENARKKPLALVDLKRWMRVCRDSFKSLKVDVLAPTPDVKVLELLVEEAVNLNLKLSLRTDCSAAPAPLAGLGLHDVFLTPRTLDGALDAWLAECAAAGLPVRLQVQPPFPAGFDAAAFAGKVVGAGVAVVNVAMNDPFLAPPKSADARESRRIVDQSLQLVREIDAAGIEANLLGLPFCLAPAELRKNILNTLQFYLDHQQYQLAAHRFASEIFQISPNAAGRALLVPLGKNVSMTTLVDQKLLRWILDGTRRHLTLLVMRRLTRQLRRFWFRPRPLQETEPAHEHELQKYRQAQNKIHGPICSRCSLCRVCDGIHSPILKNCRGLELTSEQGETMVSPLHINEGQRKYYDAIDAERATMADRYLALAEEARGVVNNQLPTREVDSYDYEIEGQWTHHMPGGNRWYSFTNTEKQSTVLTRAEPPLTINMTLGGGIAELAGFSLGRHSKIVCPMEAYSHQITLHVNEAGYYVLLRDGLPVRPTEFEGVQLAPSRLAGLLEPRISLWNIDGAIVTQTVQLWEGKGAAAAHANDVRYSVFIVTTRYARRLQAVLMSLVNQRDFDIGKLEVIIGYVPGLDATDDIIDSIRMAYPGLRIVRAPFTEAYAKSKGFLINESVHLASGEWIVLLDSDTLVPPTIFSKMDRVAATCNFMAPDGRKMLSPETTAEVLLGKIRPWEQWDTLMEGAGEFRSREADGVPIGFFQCVRKECFDKVQYREMDHFEGADWFFGYDIRQEFGLEVRLTGLPVLHLDHGGSQWYGTSKHR